MDLNYLYLRRAISLAMAEKAKCARSREAHRALASCYADRIQIALRTDQRVEA